MDVLTDVDVARLVLADLLDRGRCTRLTELWDRDDTLRARMPELARGDGTGVLELWLSDFVIVGPAGVASLASVERSQVVDLVDKPVDKFVELHRSDKDRVWSVSELARLCGLSEAHMAAAVFYRSRYLGGMIVSGFSSETGLHQQATFTYDVRNRALFAHRVDRAAPAPARTRGDDATVEREKVAARLKTVIDRLVAGANSEAWRSFAAAEWPTFTRQLRSFAPQLEGLDGPIDDASDALRTYVVLPLERGDRINAANIRNVVRRIAIVCTAVGGDTIVIDEKEATATVKDIAEDDDVQRIDVLILTATKDEYDEALKVEDGAIGPWRVEKEGPAGLEVSFRKYQKKSGGELKIALTYSIRMREAAAVAAALPVVLAYEPRYLAMCGACAGWREKTNLGDVVVGETVWRHDAGAKIVVDGKDKFKPEPYGFTLRGKWKQRALSFSMAGADWLAGRPLTLEDQSRWLLGRIFDGDPNPGAHDDRKTRCPDWGRVIPRLRKLGHLQPAGLAITDEGKAFVEEEA